VGRGARAVRLDLRATEGTRAVALVLRDARGRTLVRATRAEEVRFDRHGTRATLRGRGRVPGARRPQRFAVTLQRAPRRANLRLGSGRRWRGALTGLVAIR
jgi:hypothetical protein